MKNLYRLSCFVCALCFALFFCIPLPEVFCFYSCSLGTRIDAVAGSVDFSIENLRVEGNEIADAEKPSDFSDGIIMINSSQTFTFAVRNTGKSAIEYSLDIQISWDEQLPEAGKLFVYPGNTGDDAVLEDIQTKDSANAIIGSGVSDKKEVLASTGEKTGISETIDRAVLDAFSDGGIGLSSKDYSLKLFFYEDAEIAADRYSFSNEFFEVNIIAHADVAGNQTGWAITRERFFRSVSFFSAEAPIIEEISLPKTFFISQAGNIDLKAYAAATDETDGDITAKIQIESFPVFNPSKAGTYIITYNVSNKSGIPAAPLQITIVIWDFVKIVSGEYHSLALSSLGKVYAWGRNNDGQLGDSGNNKNAPQIIESLDGITDIAAGSSSSYALKSDGQLYAWGNNGYGQLGDNSIEYRYSPVKVAQSEGVTFVKVFAGYETAGALTADGDVYTWGCGDYGQHGTGVLSEINRAPQKIGLSSISCLAFGETFGAAVSKDGALYTWGTDIYGSLAQKEEQSEEVFAPAIVNYFSGRNIKISQISAGGSYAAAISDDGMLFTWGTDHHGCLGDGQANDSFAPQHIPLPSAAKKVAAGYSHVVLMTLDGNVYTWGNNLYGKLGIENTENLHTPKKLDGITGASDISLGAENTFIFAGTQTLYAMGSGEFGALGTGNTDDTAIPLNWAFVPPIPEY